MSTYGWTQTFGGAGGAGGDYGEAIALSSDGATVYATGTFWSSTVQIGGAGPTVANSGFSNAFVIALDAATGAAKTSFGLSSSGIQTFGGSSYDFAYGLAVSGTTVYATGNFESSTVQIGGAGPTVANSGNPDAFVIALDAATGAAKTTFGLSGSGIQKLGGSDSDYGDGLAVSGTTVYATGAFYSSTVQIGGAGPTVANSGFSNAFVIALDATTGAAKTSFGLSSSGIQTFGGSSEDSAYGLAVSGTTVYATGNFESSTVQIGGAGPTVPNSGGRDAFVIALDAATGVAKTAFGFPSSGIQKFGGTSDDGGYGLALSPDGSRVYVTGNFGSNNAGIGGTVSIASSGGADAFVLALNAADGSAITGFGSGGVQEFGGTSDDYGCGAAVSHDGTRVYVTGDFYSTDARVGGAGPAYDATGFNGFLLGLDVPPSISTIRPACGGTGGGTNVTIRGSAFASGGTVTFGGTPAASVIVVNSTTITCDTPGHAAGAVDVVVTTAGGSATKTGGFTYVADAVASVYPPVIQGHAEGVAVDAAGNCYVAGIFYGAKDFNPGVGLDAKASAGLLDVFVTRFNADGTYAWTQMFGGSNDDYASGVAVSPDGARVYVTGYFRSTDAGIGGTGSIASSGGEDAFVLALNAADGSAISGFGSGGVQKFGGTGEDVGSAVAVSPDGSRVYVTGSFNSLDAGIGGLGSVASSGGYDAFVLALNAADGSAISGFGSGGVQRFGGTSDDEGYGVAVSPDGSRVYVTGAFSGTDAGIGGLGSVASSGGDDAYVLALNASTGLGVGGFGSGGVQKFGGTSGEMGCGVAVSPDGARVYVTGSFRSLDAGVGGLGSVASSGDSDAFVLALNAADGSATTGFGSGGVQKFGGTNYDLGFAVALSPDGSRVYVTGWFDSSNAGLGGFGSVASSGLRDAFILALNASNGSAISGFASGGIQKFGGTSQDFGYCVAVSHDGLRVYVAGDFYSTDARVGGAGPAYVATGFNGFLLELNGTTGQQTPAHLVITRVNGGINPTAGVPFAVSVESRNPQDAPSVVTSDTAISLTLKTGKGVLGGTLTGMIAAGTSSGAISGVTYTTAEGGVVVTVSRTSGDTLAPGDSAPFTVAGPLAKFALVLASPQTDGVGFTGANILIAQDANGNTVTTFDASADNVTITANAPLAGTVSGLGAGANNVLNRAKDFAFGVADLTALGMIYSGSLDTGTFTATSSTGATGVSGSVTINSPGPGQPGTDMQVVMWLTIPKSVSIAWGAGTTGKTAGEVTPLDWTVKDAGGSQLGHGETCVSNDANNNMAMNLENTSNTGTNARVFAAVANSGGWNIGGTPATDTFAIQAQLGTNPQVALPPIAKQLTATATLAKGADQPLVLTVMTPTDITRDAGVQKTIFVVLTATPE